MISADGKLEIITAGILKNHAFDITPKELFLHVFRRKCVRSAFKDNFTEELEFSEMSEVMKRFELARLKAVVSCLWLFP